MTEEQVNRDATLARLRQLEMPRRFVNDRFPDRWDPGDVVELSAKLTAAGVPTVAAGELEQLLEEIYAKRARPERRIREQGIRSVAEMQTPTRQADAAWSDPGVFAREHTYRDGSFFFGRCPENGTALGHDDERHVLMIAGSRSNKGTGYIIPNHLLWQGPLISIDPKGENATVCAARRGDGNDVCIGMRQDVHVLDPFGTADVEEQYRSTFNPFDELDPSKPGECMAKAAAIADAMVVTTGNESENYWNDESRNVLQKLILHIATSDAYEPDERNMGTLRRLVIEGEKRALEHYQPPIDPETGKPKPKPDGATVLFGSMMGNPAFDGEIAAMGDTLREMRDKGDRQWVGVRSGLRTHTEWLSNPDMKTVLQSSPLRLADIKARTNGVSIFLCLPERDAATYSRWQRMILMLAAYELQGSQSMPACGHRVLMCLDEFEALGKMKTFERGISYFAGNKVQLVVVLQYVQQIQEMYDNWEAFLGNSSLKLFFDLGDLSSPEMVSNILGQIELVQYAENETATVGINSALSAGLTRGSQTNLSEQVGVAGSVGGSKNLSEAHGRNEQLTVGDTQSQNFSSTDGRASSYDQWTFFRGIQKSLPWSRGNEKTSLSGQTSKSTGTASQVSRGVGENEVVTKGTGQVWNQQHNQGFAATKGSNEQHTVNLVHGKQITRAGGQQTLLQKRELVASTDVRKWFSRINDTSHPYYPGLAVAMISGEDPAIIRRVNYFEDDLYDGLFDRNPAHPDTDPLPLDSRLGAVQIHGSTHEHLGLWEKREEDGRVFGPKIREWHKSSNEAVTKGELIATVRPGAVALGFLDEVDCLPIYAPVSGNIEKVLVPAGSPFEFGTVLATLRYSAGRARQERDILVPEDLDAFNLGHHPLYRTAQDKKNRQAERKRAEAEAIRLREAEEQAAKKRRDAERKEEQREELHRQADVWAHDVATDRSGWIYCLTVGGWVLLYGVSTITKSSACMEVPLLVVTGIVGLSVIVHRARHGERKHKHVEMKKYLRDNKVR